METKLRNSAICLFLTLLLSLAVRAQQAGVFFRIFNEANPVQ